MLHFFFYLRLSTFYSAKSKKKKNTPQKAALLSASLGTRPFLQLIFPFKPGRVSARLLPRLRWGWRAEGKHALGGEMTKHFLWPWLAVGGQLSPWVQTWAGGPRDVPRGGSPHSVLQAPFSSEPFLAARTKQWLWRAGGAAAFKTECCDPPFWVRLCSAPPQSQPRSLRDGSTLPEMQLHGFFGTLRVPARPTRSLLSDSARNARVSSGF